MENEKKIIQHVLRRIDANQYTKLKIELETLEKLIDALPSYMTDDVIKAVLTEGTEC